MEENQITCPQCGLVNNLFADACVQCGIIFVKDAAMKIAAEALDDETRKSIEAAESILDETQPPAELVVPKSETNSQLDPLKETVMIRIPNPEEVPSLEAGSSDSDTPEPREDSEMQKAKIELEALETDIEMVTDPDDSESPVSGDIKAVESAEPAVPETAEKPAESSAGVLTGTENEVSADEKNPHSKTDDGATKEPETGLMAADASAESTPPAETEGKSSVSEISSEADADMLNLAQPVEAEDESAPIGAAQSVEPELLLEPEYELKPGDLAAVEAKSYTDAATTEETAAKKDDADARAKREAQKARNDALIKQQEALLRAEARKKEEAAQAKAAASKKKKLARAKAEALEKQKAAQAKAEAFKKKKAAQAKALAQKKKKAAQARADALKKQKAAQARAEESAESVEVAAGSQSNYVKLLGLLKRYKGKAIGINYDNSAEIKEAELVEANEEFFSVMVKEKKVQYSYPLKTILTIIEGEQGVETGEDDKKARFDAVIKVFPLV
ncbi:MAG: hypothetical protein PVI00_14715 [Desulfobacterales bacterium]